MALSIEEKARRAKEATKRYRERKLLEDPDYFRRRARERYAENPEPNKERKKRWRDNNLERSREIVRKSAEKKASTDPLYNLERGRKWVRDTPELQLLKGAKRRAIQKGLEFNLTIEDIVIPEHCPVFNIPLIRAEIVANDNSPSLDRTDSTKGYVKGNVEVISHKANTLKNRNDIETLKALLSYLESHISIQ